MSRSDLASVRLTTAPVLRARFYRSLAVAVAATRPPAGIVFEATATRPVPTLTVRPGALLATVRAAAGEMTGSLQAGKVPPPLDPPTPSRDRFGVLVPISGGVSALMVRTPWVPDVPSFASLVGPGGWLGVQTFWVHGPRGGVAVARRFRLASVSTRDLNTRFDAVATALARDWADLVGAPAVTRPLGVATAWAWRSGSTRGLPPEAWLTKPPYDVDQTAELRVVTPESADPSGDGHTIVFGASGAGKTSYLARRAADAIATGERVVAIDLHGDLSPAILERLPASERSRVLALDATRRPVPGIAALPLGSTDGEREAAHLVAALKRLTPDGTDLYWGFRLERIFDTFVRLVQESHGSLLDLFGLLTNADRRDAARLLTHRTDLARFLDELGPVVRRNPEFLWSAATRLSKVVLVPALGELLAPPDGGVPVEQLLEEGRSLLVRLPFAALGPEAAAFAGTLVLSRIYLGVAARAEGMVRPPRIAFVLDEVHGFSPRLIAEILTESRKFGIRALVATQYPDRLPPEVRSAAAGALAGFVAFRVPRPTAREVGAWIGLSASEAETILPELPIGHAIGSGGASTGLRCLAPADGESGPDLDAWPIAVADTRREYPPAPSSHGTTVETETLDETLLLAVLAAEEEGHPLAPSEVVAGALALPGPARDAGAIADRWTTTLRRGGVLVTLAGCRLTPAGERLLGLGAPTGATRESGEHRALLARAFRLFARRGYRLEIVRQGRYDTTLPDAILRQLPPGSLKGPPVELAETLARIRTGWAWQFFRGRDVHVEAEVSGALRPERIRHGWAKARAHGAFVLFLVGDADRARRVRSTLRGLSLGPDRAQVWTLPTGLGRRVDPTNP